MKLSDLLSTLAENARQMEERANKWQADASARNEEIVASAKKWQETAMQRQDEINRQIVTYFDEAGENVRNQWQTMQSNWEEQFEKLRTRGEEMRTAAKKMQGGDFADWSEAYAAQMVGFAQKIQNEASQAIAAATEARAKTPAARKKT